MAYLYGASVQGIQGFIFETNRLKEIVGASEIVKEIENKFDQYRPNEILRKAGGNIKAIFTKDECKKIVSKFPKEIMQSAYGITISQAVVEMKDEFADKVDASKEVERLLRIQRNRPTVPLDLSLSIIRLAPTTARPVVKYEKIQEKSTPIDRASSQKIKAYDKFRNENPRVQEFGDISNFSNAKNKIAVIHADGNGLGELVPKLGDDLSTFSIKLEEATRNAFDNAKRDYMDIREVILGGDDMVIICNANNAMEFTKNFLENFEEETSKINVLKPHTSKLTACAGIAFCNEKYPFHYAVDLAEALCGEAKKASARKASCMMFHNIKSSNFQKWSKFIKDELTIKNDKKEIRCDFGPYYLDNEDNNNPSLDTLVKIVELYKKERSPISKLRAWIGELGKSDTYAEKMLNRINDMAKTELVWKSKDMDDLLKDLFSGLSNSTLVVEKDTDKDNNKLLKTPIYDVLQILSATEVM